MPLTLRCVVDNVLDWDIVVSEFELQSPYYVHILTNTIVKSMNPLSLLPQLGINSITSKDGFGIR